MTAGWRGSVAVSAMAAVLVAAVPAAADAATKRPVPFRSDRIEAVTIGSVSSPVLRELRREMGRGLLIHRARSGQDLSRYDLIVIDGDRPGALRHMRMHPELRRGVRRGQWVLSVDVTAGQMARALRHHAGFHAGPRGARAHLMRRTVTNGRPHVRVVQQSGRHRPVGARHMARQIAVALRTDRSAGAHQSSSAPPTELLNARYHFSEVSDGSETLSGQTGTCPSTCLAGERTSTQTPNWVVDYTYDVFLDNGSTARAQGGFQWVSQQVSVTFAPRAAGERWAQQTTTSDGVPSTVGHWTGAIDLTLDRPKVAGKGTPPITLVSASPGTENETNRYSVSSSQSFGFKTGLDVKGKAGEKTGGEAGISGEVEASWEWSFDHEYELSDWQVRRTGAAASGGASWRFAARNTCDFENIEGLVEPGDWTRTYHPPAGCFAMAGAHTPRQFGGRTNVEDGGPLPPNGLSSSAATLGSLALWRTNAIAGGQATFDSALTFNLVGTACDAWFFGCVSHWVRRTAIDANASHSLDLGAVVPVGVRSIRFYERSSVRRGRTPVEVTDARPGVDLVGVVELKKPAPTNLTLPIVTDSSQVRLRNEVSVAEGERGPECLDELAEAAARNDRAQPEGGCFLVVTSARSGGGVEGAAIRVFYGESFVESLRVLPS